MQALIDPRFDRVCEVREESFEVAEPLLWVDCDSSVTTDTHGWSEALGFFELQPPPLSAIDAAIAVVHQQYPAAYQDHVSSIINGDYPGLKVAAVYRQSDGVLIGVSAHEINPTLEDKSSVLLSISRSSADRIRLGIPGFTFFTLGPSAEDNQRYIDFIEGTGSSIVTVGDYCYVYNTWTVDLAKNRKRRQIERDRDAAISAGFSWNGFEWDADPISRSNLTGAASAVNAGIPLPEGFTWRSKDNQNVPLTSAQVIELGGAMIAHVNLKYQVSWNRKAVVDAATTMEEVESA